MRNKKIISITLAPETHEKAKQYAKQYGVKVSTLIELLINKKIKL